MPTRTNSKRKSRKPAPRRNSGGRSRRRRRTRRTGVLGLKRFFARQLPVLDHRQREVLGLGLIAVGVFMGFVLYAGWDGGRVGHGLAVALGWSVGRARVFAPIALVGVGAGLLLAPVLPVLRPLRTGAICLSASIVLALAAGTLGVSQAGAGGQDRWSSRALSQHGGILGEALYQGAHRLVQQVGVDILVVFLFLIGAILMSGASLAGVLRATGSAVADSTRLVRKRLGTDPEDQPPSLKPPEPEPEQLIVRATHLEAPHSIKSNSPTASNHGIAKPQPTPRRRARSFAGRSKRSRRPRRTRSSRPRASLNRTSRHRVACVARSPTTLALTGGCPRRRACWRARALSSHAQTQPARDGSLQAWWRL